MRAGASARIGSSEPMPRAKPKPEPRARRRLEPGERRAELLDAAENILRTNPNARVDDIVAAANAAKGTFYLYFPSWDDMIAALRERVFAGFYARHPLTPLPKTPRAWREFVEKTAIGFVDFTLEMGGLHIALFHGPSPAVPPAGDAVAVLTRLLDAGKAAGAFPKIDSATMAGLIFAAAHQTVDMIEAGADRTAALKSLRHLLRRTLAPSAGTD